MQTQKLLFEMCNQVGLDPDDDLITPTFNIVTYLNILLDYYDKSNQISPSSDTVHPNYELISDVHKIEVMANLAFAESIKMKKAFNKLLECHD
ncbi:hypothetical protein [Bombilactobacillus bombi]|uniref:hypothetical protein n=1 Tax=Bombilactobacillus bombi TaxID=1303590 RepID=UPI0015E600D3|nr:hypothetical protein [Bombilactobacillus bombi]MBA1434746.1 hypothetical protein [Bombilactobacillus bombi]